MPAPVFQTLVLSPDFEIRKQLRETLGGSVATGSSIRETRQRLLAEPVPVVLTDRELTDGSWRDLRASMSDLAHPPNLIVIASRSDKANGFWSKALLLGAYDVLAAPWHEEDLLHTVSQAAHAWHTRYRIGPKAVRSMRMAG